MPDYQDTRERTHSITTGKHTHVPEDLTCGCELVLGAFVSIASGLKIVSGQHPPVNYPEVVATFPFLEDGWGNHPPSKHSGRVEIGSDVWIGENVTILDGVSIGHGAIIGACSVVARGVLPYAVVAGNPADVIRYRFPAPIRQELLRVAWWDWPDEKIRETLPLFADVVRFVNAAT